jgi:integrase
MELLREHRKEQMAAIAEAGTRWTDHNLIFPAANGMPMRWSDFWKRFVRARTRAQLPGVRPYDLRHFGITELLEEGNPIEDVSSRAGHANVRITDEVYRHPRGHKDRTAAGATRRFWAAPAAASEAAGDGTA